MKERFGGPRSLNVHALCQEAGQLTGHSPLSDMARLHESLFDAPPAEAAVDWSAQGSLLRASGGQPGVWLHLRASVPVTLQCQRCLQPVSQALEVDRHFRFVRSEQEAERLDETAEEDVLVLTPRLDLHELLEDELILALPLVPRHEGRCPAPLPLPVDDPLAEAAPPPNPFAALAALRTPRKGGPG